MAISEHACACLYHRRMQPLKADSPHWSLAWRQLLAEVNFCVSHISKGTVGQIVDNDLFSEKLHRATTRIRKLDDVSFVDRTFRCYVGLIDPLVVKDHGFHLRALFRWIRFTDEGDHPKPAPRDHDARFHGNTTGASQKAVPILSRVTPRHLSDGPPSPTSPIHRT